MSKPAPFDPEKPPEEHFAAYADGELRGEDLVRLEEWLCAHPEGAARVEAQQQPTAFCRRAAPLEPLETQWLAAFERIESGLTSSPVGPPRQSKSLRTSTRITVGVLATAAAAAVAFVLYFKGLGVHPINSIPPPDDASAQGQVIGRQQIENSDEDLAFLQDFSVPMLILSPEDVDILSLDGADDNAIVVGALPVGKTFNLVSSGDIVLRSVAADADGVVPQMRQEPLAVPMIVAPMIGPKIERKKP
jgi:hypothetical protein